MGNYYKNRKVLFEEVNNLASKSGVDGRVVIKHKDWSLKSTEYFEQLLEFPRIITTVSQQENPKYIYDRIHINQLVFRITESIACKKVVYFAEVSGVEKYFMPNVDFIPIKEQPSDIILHLNRKNVHLNELVEISNNAFEKLKSYVSTNQFWKMIDEALNKKMM